MSNLRPSSLPMLRECVHFTPGASDYTDAGTLRHEALGAALRGDRSKLDTLEDDEFDAVEWAIGYINMHAPTPPEEYKIECHLNPTGPDLEPLFPNGGTADVISRNHLFDLKWRMRSYREQMAAYALGLLELIEEPYVWVHVLYGENLKASRYKVTREDAEKVVFDLVKRVQEKKTPATPNQYCSWCANIVGCPAYEARVNAVVDGREDWTLDNYHASQISDPEEMANALRLSKHLAKWCDAVDHHARKMVPLPGWALKQESGGVTITDVQKAFELSGLSEEEFLAQCKVGIKNISDIIAEKKGIPKAAAKRDYQKALEPVLQENKPKFKWKELQDA